VLLIDTHAHINFQDYDEDRDLMMSRAYESGVKKIIHSCTGTEEIQEILSLSKTFDGKLKPQVFASIGVHPIYIESWNKESISIMKSFLDSESFSQIKAIGETGLDYYHINDESEQKKQREIFKEQIKLAQGFNLPIILHTRDAWEDTLSIIEEFYPEGSSLSGVLHCYTGNLDFALNAISRGFYISWSGIISFKKTTNLRELAKIIPLEKTLIETDCPFLAPQAKRGQRNEPAYLKYVAETLSETLELSLEEIARITSSNAETLFRI
jgi:TatD DNase family protein